MVKTSRDGEMQESEREGRKLKCLHLSSFVEQNGEIICFSVLRAFLNKL